jgi:hypothetical protein
VSSRDLHRHSQGRQAWQPYRPSLVSRSTARPCVHHKTIAYVDKEVSVRSCWLRTQGAQWQVIATQRDVTHRQLALSAASALIVDAVEKAEGPRSSSSRGETSTPCACSSSAYKSSPFEFDIIL